ncbi:MAG: T9SS type A sorting domain-containing protein [Calditrichota bacterium]
MASGSFETHPNDGPVIADPNHAEVVYMTTDMGLGTSINRGTDIFEINDGIEAVQINDFDMNAEKTIAWSASKSGIRRVTDYAGSAESWSVFFPNGDGSPYFSIAMDHSDSTGQTAFAGNVRLYKTTDGGSSWTRVFDTQDPTHGFGFWSYVSAIAVHPEAQNVVIIGVNSARISGTTGGIFVTEDAGSSWNRIDTGVYNPEVRDLLVTFSADSTTTVYVGCEYVSDGTTSSYGVKRIIHHDSLGVPYFENDMVGETGTNITNFGAHSLAVNSDGDVYAAGRKGSDQEPRLYIKEADSTFWTLLPSGTLPSTGEASAITIGIDENGNEVPFTAIGNEIHYLKRNTSWTDGYVYPVGTEINMLFWDDLLVGTGTGLYGHYLQNPVGVESSSDNRIPSGYALEQNFPNPFNPATTIRYSIPERSRVTLEIFTVTGQRIATLVNGIQRAATHTVRWTPNNLASGVYIYRFTASSLEGSITAFSGSGRMVFLK